MQEESLRTPKPGADESDGSAPPSTEKQTSAAAFLAPYNPPPLPPLPPLPLPPVGGTMALDMANTACARQGGLSRAGL